MWLSEILKVPRLIPPGGEQGGAGEIVFFPGLAPRVEKLRGKSLGHRVGGGRHWSDALGIEGAGVDIGRILWELSLAGRTGDAAVRLEEQNRTFFNIKAQIWNNGLFHTVKTIFRYC